MPLTIKNTEQVFQGKFIKIFATYFLDKIGKEHCWEWIKKGDIAAVLPITTQGKIVLIKNFRVPVGKYVIELPAGLLDQGESPEEAARRELFEETGYVAQQVAALPVTPHAPGTADTLLSCFVATGCVRKENRSGDASEDITVFEVTPAEMLELYLNPEPDTLFNVRIFAAYYLAQQLKLV
jgi:ADP-ribose pyrophosphatase